MDAITADCQSSTAGGLGGEAIDEGIARSLTFPRALIDANLRAGSALLGFAGHCVHAETEFLEQLFRCRDLGQASRLHARFIAAMIDEGGRELTALMAAARENVARFGAAETAQPSGPPSAV
jgi:hypothetical protein